MTDLEKIEIIKKINQNSDYESELFKNFFANHSKIAIKIAFKYNRYNKKIDTMDVVQEGYIGLFEAIKAFPLEGNFNSFAYVVIKNRVINFLIKQKSLNYYENIDLNEFQNLKSLSEKPVPENLKPFIYHHINKNLSVLEGLILKWKYGLDNGTWYTMDEISEISDLSTRRLRKIVENSLKKMKISIEKESKSNNKNLFLGGK